MINISVIIPFLNEEENIPSLLQHLSNFSSESSRTIEYIFVDDGSTDESVSGLQLGLMQVKFNWKIIKLSKNFGSHAALRAGIAQASGSYISFLYADLQDPIELMDLLCEEATSNRKNVVWGIRRSLQIGFLDGLFSKAYARLMQIFVSKDFPVSGFDIVMFDRKVREQLIKNPENNSSVFLQILTMGFQQGQVLYDKRERIGGKSKWTLSKKVKLFIDSFVAFSYFPIRSVTVVGIAFFLIGVIWTGYIVLRELIMSDLDPGWPALVAILLTGFGATNIGLGIVAEYLWRTLDAARDRPVFIIDEIIDSIQPHTEGDKK